ncbi:MAG: hypothetical protein J1D88_04745 [Treponema sp.]|nr:hypothetical protein [Treponema sp.]
MNSLFLCVDIGTSSLKAALIDGAGTPLALSRQHFVKSGTRHASLEWFPAFCLALREIQTLHPLRGVDALCISGNGPTLCAQDGTTLPWHEAVPSLQTRSLFIPRIVAFKERFGIAFSSSQWLLGAPEFLIWQLTGAVKTILPESRYTSAYWTYDTLCSAGLLPHEAQKLPPFCAPATRAGVLHADDCVKRVAQNGSSRSPKTGQPETEFLYELEGLPVFYGAPDFVSALVGTNTLRVGALCDRAGSSEGVNLCTDSPVYGTGLRTLPSPIPGLWNVSVLLPDTGIRFAECRRRLEHFLGTEITSAQAVDAFFSATEKSPAELQNGKRVMFSIASEVKNAVHAVTSAAGLNPPCMTVTGGQASNSRWNQCKCDVLERTILLPVCTDAELLGDAIFAATGLGLYDSIQDAADSMCRTARRFEPAICSRSFA